MRIVIHRALRRPWVMRLTRGAAFTMRSMSSMVNLICVPAFWPPACCVAAGKDANQARTDAVSMAGRSRRGQQKYDSRNPCHSHGRVEPRRQLKHIASKRESKSETMTTLPECFYWLQHGGLARG